MINCIKVHKKFTEQRKFIYYKTYITASIRLYAANMTQCYDPMYSTSIFAKNTVLKKKGKSA